MSKVRTRFAPSPTGTPESVHLGFVIRALWNYAYAKKNKGQFILRIEDTDRKRSRKDTEDEIYKVLKKFGIRWDEGPDVGGPFGPYRQSERLSKYQEAARILVERGYAYYDFEAPVREKEEIKAAYESEEKLKELKIRPKARSNKLEDSLKRVEKGEPYVVRVKIPEDKVFEYDDWILKKRIKFFGKEVPDLILLKSDGFPTYHLAVVVDDADMKISHVLRGQEWISSTPIHLFLYEGLKKEVPKIGHFSVIIDPRTGKKFSKRDMSALFGVNTWLNKGYLPEALLNYLMLLGWAPKDNREFFTLDEFVQAFDQDGVQKANPTFDVNKLDWFNQQYIEKLKNSRDRYISLISNASVYNDNPKFQSTVAGTIDYMPTRMTTLNDFDRLGGYIYKTSKEIEPLVGGPDYSKHMDAAKSALGTINESDWKLSNINENLSGTISQNNFKTGDFYMDLRTTISGSRFTPPINETLVPIGKTETMLRIEKGLEKFKKN